MIVTRFAPSPTGFLHLGHAYAAIVAQDNGDRFLVRIEDLDQGRSRAPFVEAIFFDLKWLGLSWDEPVLRQSRRGPAYAAALEKLTAMGATYPCFWTRKEITDEIARAGEAQHGPDGPLYPGTCRALSPAERADRMMRGDAYALRLDVAKPTLRPLARRAWMSATVESNTRTPSVSTIRLNSSFLRLPRPQTVSRSGASPADPAGSWMPRDSRKAPTPR